MSFLKKVTAVAKISAKNSFAYRINFILSMIFMPLSLILYYFIWKSVYSYSGQEIIRGYTFAMLIGYFVIEMITSMIIWTRIDENLSDQVRKGKMTQKLVRPLDYFIYNFFTQFGGHIISLIFQVIPLFLFGLIVFKIKLTVFSLLFIPVVVLAHILNYLIAFLFGLSAFWLKKITGIISIRRIIVDFISGGAIPLTFLPLWFQSLSWWLPFQYTRFLPINVFLGAYDLKTIFLIMIIQIAWIIGLYLLSRIIWKIGIDRYTGVGQ